MKVEPDPYALIGVRRNCTDAELTSAYRKLAIQLHPDTSSVHTSEARLKEVNVAYARVLQQRQAGYRPSAAGHTGYKTAYARERCAPRTVYASRRPHSQGRCVGHGAMHPAVGVLAIAAATAVAATTVVAVVKLACWSGRTMAPSRNGGVQCQARRL